MVRIKFTHRFICLVSSVLMAAMPIGEAFGQAARPSIQGQQGPSGGPGGRHCPTNDVNPDWRLVSVTVRSGFWIDGIDLGFQTPGTREMRSVHCGGNSRNASQPLILGADEFIVRVSGKYGNNIDSLRIETSRGKSRDFGNVNSN